MNTTPMSLLLDHLWQSTVFAAVVGLLSLTLRKNRARIRHGLWLAASVKFLVPLSLLIAAGSYVRWPQAQQAAGFKWSAAMVGMSEPFTEPIGNAPLPAPRQATSQFRATLFGVWLCGFLGIAGSWAIRWRRLAGAVRAGSPVDLNLPIRARLSPTLVEPGVFGIFRPVLLLPAGIFEQLTPVQLDTVIAQELEHVLHRDNFTSAFHMFVETTFWFHPLVWWIGKRMMEERERACDEAVLRTCSQPRVYAEAILNVCKLYVESPLRCVSGITGANLTQRIEAIMTPSIIRDLHVAKKLALATAGTAALLVPMLIGMLHSRAAIAQPRPPAAVVPMAVVSETPQIAPLPSPVTRPPDPGKPNGPPEEIFEGSAQVSAADLAWANAFVWNPKEQSEPGTVIVTAGLPGRHASIQPYLRLTDTMQTVHLYLPLDTLSGRVSVAAAVVRIADSGAEGRMVANLRDEIQLRPNTNASYRSMFTLKPGSYLCRVLVREQATGLTYMEAIAFQIK